MSKAHNLNANIAPKASPITRLFISTTSCPKCGLKRELNVLKIIINKSNQKVALAKWRCRLDCEMNLKEEEWVIVNKSTWEKMKRRINKKEDTKQ